jgi:hypothetical protein
MDLLIQGEMKIMGTPRGLQIMKEGTIITIISIVMLINK